MNEKLVELYKSNWTNLSIGLNHIISDKNYSQKPTNPLLLSIDEKIYLNSEIKVLFLGQETNDWGKDFTGNIEETLEIYDDFYNSEYALNSYGGHFWNGINRFIELLEKKFSEKKVSYTWSNVVKIGASGRDQNHPKDYIYKIELEYFKVLEKELEILKPDIILFVSGPNYDSNIEKNLQGVEFMTCNSSFSKRQLAKLKFKDFHNIYRTYHPNCLWRNNINEYFETIVLSFLTAFKTLDILQIKQLPDDKYYSWNSRAELILQIENLFKSLKDKNIESLSFLEEKCKFCYPNARVYKFFNEESGYIVGRYVITETDDQYIFEECKNNPIPDGPNGSPF